MPLPGMRSIGAWHLETSAENPQKRQHAHPKSKSLAGTPEGQSAGLSPVLASAVWQMQYDFQVAGLRLRAMVS